MPEKTPTPTPTPTPESTPETTSEPTPESTPEPTSEGETGIPDYLQEFASIDMFGGSEAEQAVEFNLQLLPEPELIFTADSIRAYNNLTGELEQQSNVLKVDWWKNKPKDVAIAKFKEKFQAYTISELGEHAGGPLFELTQGDTVIYASLINNPAKRTLKSSTVFVLWTANPLI